MGENKLKTRIDTVAGWAKNSNGPLDAAEGQRRMTQVMGWMGVDVPGRPAAEEAVNIAIKNSTIVSIVMTLLIIADLLLGGIFVLVTLINLVVHPQYLLTHGWFIAFILAGCITSGGMINAGISKIKLKKELTAEEYIYEKQLRRVLKFETIFLSIAAVVTFVAFGLCSNAGYEAISYQILSIIFFFVILAYTGAIRTTKNILKSVGGLCIVYRQRQFVVLAKELPSPPAK